MDIPSGVTVIDHPLIRVKLTRIRDENSSSEEFRRYLSEISTLMVYEVTKNLSVSSHTIRTPLAECEGFSLSNPLVIVPILRAGMGMLDGIRRVLPEASVGHVGMFRNEKTLRPESYYLRLPTNVTDADLIVVDPMLATGGSATDAIAQLKGKGAVKIRYVCLVSCLQGLKQLRNAHPDVPVFTAVIDQRLDDRGYIVPGLGDAGDRYFGTV